MKKEELKQLIKEIIISEDLSRFRNYDDYEHGDPKQVAEKLIVLTEKYLKSISRAFKQAGPFLSPSIKAELWGDLKKKFDEIKV
jgi:hypothetical protein